MVDYYPDFREDAALKDDLEPNTDVAIDHGGDCLPFHQLSGRRFEILVYRVKLAERSQDDVEITLMKGVSEQGRDVVVYQGGVLMEVVQCKNLSTRIDRGALIREICKLALHHHAKPSILGESNVRYEIWCPGGFTDPAQELINHWPASWTETAIRSYTETVLKEYDAFARLTWNEVKDTLLANFPKRMRPTKIDGYAATPRVKRYQDVYKTFFLGTVMVPQTDLEESLQRILNKGGIRQYHGDDVLDIADRIQSFHADHRIYLGAAYFLGLTDKLMAAMTPAEFGVLNTNAMVSITGNAHIFMVVTKRRIYEVVQALCDSIIYRNLAFPAVVRRALAFRAFSNFNHWLPDVPGLMSAPIDQRAVMNDSALLAACVTEEWDDIQTVITAYDPQKHPPGSDLEFRYRIGTHTIKGYSDRAIFEHELMSDIDANLPVIEALLKEIMQYVPREFAVVSDTRNAFTDKRLLGQTVETIRRLIPTIGRNNS